MIRYALIHTSNATTVKAYLPPHYSVIWVGQDPATERGVTVIAGTDQYGWTLGQYVLPRLASGMYYGEEIDLSHPIMKEIPDNPRIGTTETVVVDGDTVTGRVYHVRDNGWACVETDTGRCASGPSA